MGVYKYCEPWVKRDRDGCRGCGDGCLRVWAHG